MYEANPFHTDNSKSRTQAKEPVDGNLILDIKLIFLEGAIVPDIHDNHENEGECNGYPSSFQELNKRSREIECFNGAKEENETYSHKNALMPTQDYHQGHQAGGD